MLVNLAVIQDLIADTIPDREALIWRDRVFTYAQLTERCRRLANALIGMGLGCHSERAELQPWQSGQDHLAIYLYNCNEYVEAMYGAYQARATSVNINYRYVAEELLYVLENSGASAIVFHAAFAPVLAQIRQQLPRLRHFIQVADESGNALLEGAVDYDELLAGSSPDLPALPYSADDLYVLFTGGTTGMPKGVLWRQEDVFFNGLGGHIPGFPRLDTEEKLVEHVKLGIGGRFLILPPFMHGAAQWAAFNTFHRGATAVLPDQARRLDPHSIWQAVEKHGVNSTTIIGDAFARPLLAALREKKYDVSSMQMIGSTAAVLSPAVRSELLSLMPQGMVFLESFGGSELGLQAMSYDTDSGRAGLPAYDLREGTVVLEQDRSGILRPEDSPGRDSEIGWVASSGHLPLGYLNDPEGTRRVFPVIDGVRYAVGGDRARYTVEGKLVILGRESMCINTGGEKVYVEEVERVVKSHPAIYDALVVGVPSERWGQQVTAVASLLPGSALPSLDEMRAHCRSHLADYKIPRGLVPAPEIVRSPSGKPDYGWALEFAKRHLTSQ
jgi:acyl-CoA synthetase (AMP-forming)/AMP-acid ligase II